MSMAGRHEPDVQRAGDGGRKAEVLDLLTRSLEQDIAARDNVVIGHYAEALVAISLGGDLAPHRWEAWDCVGPDGGTIQVKTSTGMSIGKPEDAAPSSARWSGFKPGFRWIVETNEFEREASWHADIWVLARVEGLDPFDDGAWSFFVLKREQIQAIGAMSVSATRLVDLGHRSVGLADLPDAYSVARAIAP